MTLKTKTALSAEIQAQFLDNTTGLIAPANLRNVTQDIVDSYAQSSTGQSINVTDPTYGADPTGTNDSAPAIQAAINALPAAGGTIVIPAGTYKIGTTLTIGNGSATRPSSRTGVRLVGLGVAAGTTFTGFPPGSCVRLLWSGGNTVMLQINGPLQGWGIENIEFDGNSLASSGLLLLAGMNGANTGLTFSNFLLECMRSTTYDSFAGVTDANSMHNTWVNTTFNIKPGAHGLVLTGGQTPAFNALSNTCYETFINTIFNLPATGTSIGLLLQACDSNSFINSHFFGGAGATTTCVLFDYTTPNVLGNWPSSNVFLAVDASASAPTGVEWQNAGTPSTPTNATSTAARPNIIYGLQEGNLGEFPNLPNTSNGLPLMAVAVNLQSQSAVLGPIPVFTPWYNTQLLRINYYLYVQVAGTAGTCSVSFNWNDGAHAQTFTSATANAATAGSFAQGSVSIVAVSPTLVPGSVVSYTVNFAGVTGAAFRYGLIASFERLN